MSSTLRLFALNRLPIEPGTAWYLNDLGEFRGKQELYTRQSPQRLKALRESALIESAVSSNRIEGVCIDPQHLRDILIAPKPLFRDRDEEEVRGYRDALTLIHQNAEGLPIDNETIRRLHAQTRGQVGRYISLERLVEQNQDRYYETLEHSSQGWHEGRHNPWPYIHYILSIMKTAYLDLVDRVGDIKAPRGEQREQVIQGIDHLLSRPGRTFQLRELERMCPGVSRDMVRHVLREQQQSGAVTCAGRGAGALWSRGGGHGGKTLPPNEGNEGGKRKGNEGGNEGESLR